MCFSPLLIGDNVGDSCRVGSELASYISFSPSSSGTTSPTAAKNQKTRELHRTTDETASQLGVPLANPADLRTGAPVSPDVATKVPESARLAAAANGRRWGHVLARDHAAHVSERILRVLTIGIVQFDRNHLLVRHEEHEGLRHGPSERLFGEESVGGELHAVIPAKPALCVLEIYGKAGVGGDDQEIQLSRETETLRREPDSEVAFAFSYAVSPERPSPLERLYRGLYVTAPLHLVRRRRPHRQDIAIERNALAVRPLLEVGRRQLDRRLRPRTRSSSMS